MGTLGDHHHVAVYTARGNPLAQKFFVQAATVDKTGVKRIAARLEPGIPDQSTFGQSVAVVATQDQL